MHDAEKIISARFANKEVNNSNNTSHSNPINTAPPNRNKLQTSPSYVAGWRVLLIVLRLEIGTSTDVTTALVMCVSCCTHSLISTGLAQRLNLTMQKLDILVNGFNLTESLQTQQVALSVYAKLDHQEASFRVTSFVKHRLSFGSETNEFPIMQDRFPHMQPIKTIVYNYSDVEIILGVDV